MPGMGRSLQAGNSVIVSAFHAALFHQLLVVLLVGAVCAIGWNVVRSIQYRRLKTEGLSSFPSKPELSTPEPVARRILRIGFGCLWILDGLLQIQSSMPLGLPSNVLQPAAAGSPGWVQHLVNSGANIWIDHPIQAAAASVWIQLGLGLWLIVAPRGRWSRLAGLASAAWGLIVWGFGEAFGGIFAPGLTWLFGAPGAVLLYCVAGVLIALPERFFHSPRLGRAVLALGGVFLIGMAVLQAWPGRGYWQGRGGTLSAMVQTMAQTPQPHVFSSWLSSFGSFDAAHGWGVNLFVVLALVAIGGLLLSGRRRFVFIGLVALGVLCLADWVLVEDLGFLGGTGTDPNSMLPMFLLFTGAYAASFRVPVATEVQVPSEAGTVAADPLVEPRHAGGRGALSRRPRRPGRRRHRHCPDGDGCHQQERRPDPERGTRRHAQRPEPPGSCLHADRPARPRGQPRQPAGSRAGADLPRPGLHVGLPAHRPGVPPDRPAAWAARPATSTSSRSSPTRSTDRLSFTNQFDSQEGLDAGVQLVLPDRFAARLQHVWNSYGILVDTVANGAMIAHSDLAFVINSQGRERDALIDDPGPTQTFASSFSSLLLSRIQDVLHS